MFHYFSNERLSEKNGESATITALNWLALEALSLLSLIPYAGVIVFLILYIIIGVKATTAPSIRSYIKLNLIVSAIVVVIAIIIGVFFAEAIFSGAGGLA